MNLMESLTIVQLSLTILTFLILLMNTFSITRINVRNGKVDEKYHNGI